MKYTAYVRLRSTDVCIAKSARDSPPVKSDDVNFLVENQQFL